MNSALPLKLNSKVLTFSRFFVSLVGDPACGYILVCRAGLEGDQSLIDVVISKRGLPIRLTDERWAHISEEHSELARMRAEVLDAVANPARVYAGHAGELLARKEIVAGKWLVAVYRGLRDDGFVITSFLTRRIASFARREQLCP